MQWNSSASELFKLYPKQNHISIDDVNSLVLITSYVKRCSFNFPGAIFKATVNFSAAPVDTPNLTDFVPAAILLGARSRCVATVLRFLEPGLQLRKNLKIGAWNLNHSTSVRLYRILFVRNALSALIISYDEAQFYLVISCWSAWYFLLLTAFEHFEARRWISRSVVSVNLCTDLLVLSMFSAFTFPEGVAWAFISKMIWQESTWI